MTLSKMNILEQKILGLFVKTKGIISKPLLGGMGHIFMLHRVSANNYKEKHTYNKGLKISQITLEKYILFFISKNYEFISLDEFHNRLINKIKSNKKFICFTLDDGYKDNLIYGFPVFKKHNIPFTIYITNCFPNYNANLWWYWLEEKMTNTNSIDFKNERYDWNTEQEKLKVYNVIRTNLKNLEHNEINELTSTFFKKSKNQIQKELSETCLSWKEILKLHNDPLVTIGSHTMNHISLKNIGNINIMKKEIIDSKNEIESKINSKVDHFAYPYGGLEDASTREFLMTKDLNFKTATLNYPGNIFIENKNYQMSLPRYPLSYNFNEEKINNVLNGITHYSINKLKKTIKY